MDHLRIVWQTGETLLESMPFADDPEGTRYNILLAVQEMLTNVLRHAYRGTDSEPVEVVFALDDDGVEITLKDRGPAFNPVEAVSPELGDALPEAAGGYGIMIAKMVMDSLCYEHADGWNVLRMFKAVNSGVALTAQDQG